MTPGEDAQPKDGEEDANHKKDDPLISPDELAERANAQDNGKQHRRYARREDEGRRRQPPPSAFYGRSHKGWQKRDDATGRKEGQDPSQKSRNYRTRVDECVHGCRRHGSQRFGSRLPSRRRNAPSEIRP